MASADTPPSEIVDREPAYVAPDVDQEQAAAEMASHAERSLAVVDHAGRFRGLIPPHRMLAVALAEREDDLARLGGFLATTAPRRTAEEQIGRRLWHRLPWLLLGRVLTQELATGAIMGAGIAAAFLSFAWAVWGDASVAIAVALALFASCSIATVVAMALPTLLHRLGRDPAFAPGPLATVIQDLLSIAIYFGTAVVLAGERAENDRKAATGGSPKSTALRSGFPWID